MKLFTALKLLGQDPGMRNGLRIFVRTKISVGPFYEIFVVKIRENRLRRSHFPRQLT